jgi:hypothetical protein
MYVTLYIVHYSYVFQSHLTVCAEEVPNVCIRLNYVLLYNTLIFPVFCTWRLSQWREDHRPSAGKQGAEGIVRKLEGIRGSWRKLSTEKLYKIYRSTDTIGVVREGRFM